MSKILTAGMKRRATYESLVRDTILEPKDKIKLPNREASILRRTQQLSRYDDFLGLETVNEKINKERIKQLELAKLVEQKPMGTMAVERARQSEVKSYDIGSDVQYDEEAYDTYKDIYDDTRKKSEDNIRDIIQQSLGNIYDKSIINATLSAFKSGLKENNTVKEYIEDLYDSIPAKSSSSKDVSDKSAPEASSSSKPLSETETPQEIPQQIEQSSSTRKVFKNLGPEFETRDPKYMEALTSETRGTSSKVPPPEEQHEKEKLPTITVALGALKNAISNNTFKGEKLEEYSKLIKEYKETTAFTPERDEISTKIKKAYQIEYELLNPARERSSSKTAEKRARSSGTRTATKPV